MLELAVRVVLSLSVVLGVLWLTARLANRRFGGGQRTVLRVRARQPLSRSSSVAVVEVGSRVVLLGVSDGGVRLLTELDPEEITEPTAGPVPGQADGSVVRRTPDPTTPLTGSLLAPQTWKQAWAAATGRGSEVAERSSPGDHA